MSSFPWTKPGAKGKPNNHSSKPTQAEARLLATLRSALHEAQTKRPTGSGEKDTSTSRWALRKAEWECPECHTRNFLHLGACRACKSPWRPGLVQHPAGAPPPPRTNHPAAALGAPKEQTNGAAQQDNQMGSGSNGPPATVVAPESMQAAEIALQAARQAHAPQTIIEHWEKELEARRTAATAKVPMSLRARLATATAEANAAMQAKEKALKTAEAAREHVINAEEALRLAEETECKAAAHLKQVSSEVGPATPPEPSPDAGLLAALTKALDALDQACGTQQQDEAKATLANAHAAAKAAVATATGAAAANRQAPTETAPQKDAPMAEATPEAAASHSPAREAQQAQCEQLAAARKAAATNRAEELFRDLTEAGEDQEVKKARLAEALNQAWGDQPFLPTQVQPAT